MKSNDEEEVLPDWGVFPSYFIGTESVTVPLSSSAAIVAGNGSASAAFSGLDRVVDDLCSGKQSKCDLGRYIKIQSADALTESEKLTSFHHAILDPRWTDVS